MIFVMEGYDDRTYGDSFADVYDDWYEGITDAEATVARLAELSASAGGPVLELGIGTGRLSMPLAERGVDVWGIDASEAMVQRLRGKPGGDAIPVAIGDMAELDLAGLPGGREARFGVVFAAYNTFFNLPSAAAQARCFRRVADVLRPGGFVVIEAYVPNEEAPPSGVEARRVELDRVILTVSRREPASQIVNGQHMEITERGIRMRPWVICYATPAQIDAMADAAGLGLVQRWSDWRGAPFDDDSIVHVSVYGGR